MCSRLLGAARAGLADLRPLSPLYQLRLLRRERACPHPVHRLRHIHGDERLYGYVAQCMECSHLFRDWPGGSHDATECRTFSRLG